MNLVMQDCEFTNIISNSMFTAAVTIFGFNTPQLTIAWNNFTNCVGNNSYVGALNL